MSGYDYYSTSTSSNSYSTAQWQIGGMTIYYKPTMYFTKTEYSEPQEKIEKFDPQELDINWEIRRDPI
jgi:hypothetical protein